jgi:hypothetical protein
LHQLITTLSGLLNIDSDFNLLDNIESYVPKVSALNACSPNAYQVTKNIEKLFNPKLFDVNTEKLIFHLSKRIKLKAFETFFISQHQFIYFDGKDKLKCFSTPIYVMEISG